MKIFLISGKAQNGKDYVASMMRDYIEEKDKACLIIRFADIVKYICKQYLGWNGLKDLYGRTLLQTVGTNMRLGRDETIWADITCRIISYFSRQYDYVLIPDWRFNILLLTAKKHFDVTTIRVNRYNLQDHTKPYLNTLTSLQRNHISLTELDNFNFDYTIDNWGNSWYNNDKEKMLKIKEILNELV